VRSAVGAGPDLGEFLTETVDRFTSVCRAMGDSPELGNGFKNFLQDVCAEIANSLCGALGESVHTIDTLRTANSDLEGRIYQLDHDMLTGAFNRRGFVSAARAAFSAAQPAGDCALAVIELDDLIALNQSHGRAAGDAALSHIATALPTALKEHGVVIGRLDAAAFALTLVPQTTGTDRNALRRDLARALTSLRLGVENGVSLPLSFCVGLVWLGASFAPAAEVEPVLARAEQLLNDAKRSGKGRLREVEVAAPKAA
jgi:diguanylate cyclase (GGDEF)-like protein